MPKLPARSIDLIKAPWLSSVWQSGSTDGRVGPLPATGVEHRSAGGLVMSMLGKTSFEKLPSSRDMSVPAFYTNTLLRSPVPPTVVHLSNLFDVERHTEDYH